MYAKTLQGLIVAFLYSLGGMVGVPALCLTSTAASAEYYMMHEGPDDDDHKGGGHGHNKSKTLYVSPTGSDSASGRTPAKALRTIQAAVNKCDDEGFTIYVAPGIYKETIEIGVGKGRDAADGDKDDPNRIIGDFSGQYTGATPGPVILSGGNSRRFGIHIMKRSYWEFFNLSIRGQTQYGVYGRLTSGIRIENCSIKVPSFYAVFLLGGAEYTIEKVDFDRNGSTGHCIWIFPYGKFKKDAYIHVRRCDFSLSGSDFLSTPYNERKYPSNRYRRVFANGLIVFGYTRRGSRGLGEIVVENNVFSDLSIPLYVFSYNRNKGTDVRVSNNTIVGSMFSLYINTYRQRSVLVSNNVVDDCYYSPYLRGATVNGLLMNNIRSDQGEQWFINTEVKGLITGEDPMLADPAEGDWAPTAGSPLIDAGYAIGAPEFDYVGNTRPFDGDRNGKDEFDLGAVEFGGTPSLFVDVSETTGFGIYNDSDDHRGSGLHWGDLDDDGDLDAIVTGRGSAVLLNNGDSFSSAPLGKGKTLRQGALLDVENDGDLDFFGTCYGTFSIERIFINDGSGRFTVGDDAGFAEASNNEGVAAGDINGDGLADLVMFSANGNLKGINISDSETIEFDTKDKGGELTERPLAGNGDYVSSADVNDDGYPDYFYHYANGVLFISEGDGSYSADPSAISVATGNSYKFGSAWGDFDNDGDMDLFTPSRARGTRGALFEDVGSSYVNVAGSVGIDNVSEQYSAAWGDYDNDGDLDLLIATWDHDVGLLLYRNNDGDFDLADDGPKINKRFQDAVFVDYDNDGDLDIAATCPSGKNLLLENKLDNGSALRVRAVLETAGGAGVDAVGARIELFDADGKLLGRRETGSARGYGGTSPMWVHFGGVDAVATYVVRVTWPGGEVTSAKVVPSEVSSSFGSRSVARLLTMTNDLRPGVKIVRWREVSPADD